MGDRSDDRVHPETHRNPTVFRLVRHSGSAFSVRSSRNVRRAVDLEDRPLPVDCAGTVWGDDPPRYIEYYLAEKYGTDWRDVPDAKRRENIAHYWAMVDLLDEQIGPSSMH